MCGVDECVLQSKDYICMLSDVPRRADASSQTIRLLTALGREGQRWRYGYDLGKETGLKSGSLYPILIRLADRWLLETDWDGGPPRGWSVRHLYRLTSSGEAHLALLEERGDATDGTAGGRRRALGFAGWVGVTGARRRDWAARPP